MQFSPRQQSQLLTNPLQVRSKSVYPVKKVVNTHLDQLPSNYQLIERAGQGSFGEIYKIYNTTLRILQACKVEYKDQKQNPQTQQLLPKEYKVLQIMRTTVSTKEPYHLIQTPDYNIIIMPYFGTGNLEELRKKCKEGRFSRKTTLQIGSALIDSIGQLHERKFVHRDIKPENFIVGSQGDHHKVYLIDYGLAKQFEDDKNIHIPMTQNKGMVGTARYTSINSHKGLEQSRRDDLEAIGYMLLYLYLGHVPWQNFPFQYQSRQEKFQKICEEKVKFQQNISSVDCFLELKRYFDYVRDLKFEQKPDYSYLKSLFKQDFTNIQKPLCFDWCPKTCTITDIEQECDIVSNEVPIHKKQMEEKRVGLMSGTTDFTFEKRLPTKFFNSIKEESPEQNLQQFSEIPDDNAKINMVRKQQNNQNKKSQTNIDKL